MKILKRDRKQLEGILANLLRGQSYILKDEILVCRRKGVATTTLDFSNAKGESCVSVDKQIGSDLATLHTGIGQLKQLLEGVE